MPPAPLNTKPTATWHPVHPRLIETRKPIRVALIGCGGNGTAVVRSLVRLHRALRALGQPGLTVGLVDGDDVSEANLARQPYSPADVGLNKAIVLANRLNISYDLRWEARGSYFEPKSGRSMRRTQILISCVDTAKARSTITAGTEHMRSLIYSMDLGNSQKSGQLALGTHKDVDVPLPSAAEKWPEIIDPDQDEDEGPSCSSAEALRRQDLFVHDTLASCAGNILWSLFRRGRIRFHGAFANLRSGQTRSIPVPAPSETNPAKRAGGKA